MDSELSALTTIFTEFYYWITVVFMFLIHVGFCTYEVGVVRRRNIQHTLMKNTMLIPVVTITFFFFGWWIYFAFVNGPGITGGLVSDEITAAALPWADAMGPNLQDRIQGVFWAAFLLFSWTAASIVSGTIVERVRTGAFLLLAVLVGSVAWIIDAAWGWSPNGWMVQVMGYHDAYASGVIHAVAGGAALGVVIVLGPRIGRFGADLRARVARPQNVWLVCLGLFLIYTGFWGFYVACNIPILDVGADGEPFFTATTIYLTPTTLSGITFNFLMSLSGGLLAAYLISRGDPFWTYSGGLAGIITASAGNDVYHPVQAMLIGAVGVIFAYKLHHWVERRFKVDDAVGAIAVHGYAGFLGVVIAGFMLWGYPAAAAVEPGLAWFTTADGSPMVNPIGNFLGAIIMFWVLGFLPAFVLSKILARFNLLRVPPEVELAGLDTHDLGDAYPYFADKEYVGLEPAQLEAARTLVGTGASGDGEASGDGTSAKDATASKDAGTGAGGDA